jgi:hypothetical protein
MVEEMYLAAVERTLADLVGRFERTPDFALTEADLEAALFCALHSREALADLYTTRDGRRTGLIHRHYPALLSYRDGLSLGPGNGRDPHAVGVLQPWFIRSHPLDVVANADGRSAARVADMLQVDDRRPLLASIRLRLVDELSPPVRETLEADFYRLVRAEPDAARCYLGIFCRHWDLQAHLAPALDDLARWCANERQVSVVAVQAYRDDIGGVFSGRYLNLWSHMAPLPPLEPARRVAAWRR